MGIQKFRYKKIIWIYQDKKEVTNSEPTVFLIKQMISFKDTQKVSVKASVAVIATSYGYL